MVRCPRCGEVLPENANFCIKCGAAVIGRKEEVLTAEVICEFCKHPMELVDPDRAMYVCAECGAYFGDFMHKGVMAYYTTGHLRVGQYIQNKMKDGRLRLKVSPLGCETELDDLARDIARELSIGWEEARERLTYLIEGGILRKKRVVEGGNEYIEITFGGGTD